MPDTQMNHSFDLISQMGSQKGLKLFVIQFDLLGQFSHALNHLQQFFPLK